MIFDNIELTWQGQVHTIPANKVMGAIARVEDVVTLGELNAYAQSGRSAPVAKFAMAYGALLRYAGAKVTDDEIYLSVFKDEGQGGAVLAAITNVMSIMIPPAVRRAMLADVDTTTKTADVAGNA